MADVVRSGARNTLAGRTASNNTTAWTVVASDYSTYASLAALTAAGKKPYPALDQGQPLESLLVRSDNASGADGANFYVAFNRTDAAAPTDDTADDLVDGAGGQTFSDLQVRNVWLRKLTGTDRILLRGRY